MADRAHKLIAAGTTALASELLLAHYGGVGIIVGLGLAAAAYHAVDTYEEKGGQLPSLPARQKKDRDPEKPSLAYRLLNGKSAREEIPLAPASEPAQVPGKALLRTTGADTLPPPMATQGMFVFSSLLDAGFVPSMERIYLATTDEGKPIYCAVEDLCHVATAGNTKGGKTSILRMLMTQICRAGAQVLLLNPHYTGYDLKHNEDWTPFTPYLLYDPMECRHYPVIEHYLKYTAETLLPNRLERFARSQPTGTPYFLVLDELPAIIRHVPRAQEYLREILEQGRKVGIFLISAAQDFLVKSISPDSGGGSARECYRTAYYVGGDERTAQVLLDMKPSLIPEDQLGQGPVMLRCAANTMVKKAGLCRVPYLDNASLYILLGPSTYRREQEIHTEELEMAPPESVATHSSPPRMVEAIRNMRAANYTDEDIMKLVGMKPQEYRQAIAYLDRAVPNTPVRQGAEPTPLQDYSRMRAYARTSGPPSQAQNEPENGSEEVRACERTNAMRQPEEPTHQDFDERSISEGPRLSSEQVPVFIGAYKVSGNKDKSLYACGANTRYRAHADEIIRDNGLKKEGA